VGNWKFRLPGPKGLDEIREVAEDIERQSKRPPAKTGNWLETFARILFLTTAGISAGFGAVHLWKAAFPKHPAPKRSEPPSPDVSAMEPELENYEHRRRHARRNALASAHPGRDR
jgi:hypothetical protein